MAKSKRTTKPTEERPAVSDQVRAGLRESGITIRELEKQAGVPLSLIVRFLRGENIRTDKMDALVSVIPAKIRNKIRG